MIRISLRRIFAMGDVHRGKSRRGLSARAEKSRNVESAISGALRPKPFVPEV
jgi:hypothetical protein